MEKDRELRNGRSNRFSNPMRQTGGDNDVFLDKSLKKEKMKKLSCVGEMNQLSHSTTTGIKRVNFPQKFSDHFGFINHASAPRKLRSAMKKRQHEPQNDNMNSRKNNGFELQSTDCTKKCKSILLSKPDPKIRPEYKNIKESVITKDEEEAAAALFALAQTSTNHNQHNKTSQVKPLEGTNEIKSKYKCLIHVDICRFIKDLQLPESKELMKVNESNQEACVNNVSPDTNPQKIINECNHLTGLRLTNSQENYSIGFDDHFSTEKQELPYLGNQFASTSCYQNWNDNQTQNTNIIAPDFRSSIQLFGSKNGLKIDQQRCISMAVFANKGKMQINDHDIDSGPTLKLSL